jgi:quercetin dioxygenase-like cupin family protein
MTLRDREMLNSALMRSRLLVPVLLLTAIALTAQNSSQVELTAEPHHRLLLENEYVRVFHVEVPPHDATLMHAHHHDYIFVTLGASEIENDVQGKPPVTLKLQDGEARFVSGNFSHLARNLAGTPFRNVTIELLQDEAARNNPPPPWDEERGLSILHGGTQDIIFVKDGVRVTETDLQPGADLPSHHHIGPHLVVAITDLDLRNDVEGKSPVPVHLNSGEVKWVPGGFTHSLTNIGKQQAKFVTLEFH